MKEDRIEIHGRDINLDDCRKISKNTGNITYERQLLDDEDTGMMIKLIRYPKGTVTPLHDHNCAHGMYVIKGTLYTDRGNFEAGSFVWFKEGGTMIHGGKDEDVECLFITNKPFDIRYMEKTKS
ncbi:MAG: cupin domain-containing protein [Clostridiales bacterium]|nr:cupin domain-containing protein [Clostridiales bacterium]